MEPRGLHPQVKVLTSRDEQKVSLPPGVQFEPPRLGKIGASELYINRRIEFTNFVEETSQDERALTAEERALQTLQSLKRAVWLVVVLLTIIFITALVER